MPVARWADRWSAEGEMRDARGHFSSIVLNDKVWAIGGWDPYNKVRATR